MLFVILERILKFRDEHSKPLNDYRYDDHNIWIPNFGKPFQRAHVSNWRKNLDQKSICDTSGASNFWTCEVFLALQRRLMNRQTFGIFQLFFHT